MRALAAIVQAAIATASAIIGWDTPISGAVILGSSGFKLYVTVEATCVAAAILGMALSALAHESRLQAFRLLVKASPEGVPAGEIAGGDQRS